MTGNDKRIARGLGWVAGGGLLLLVNFAVALAVSPQYPNYPVQPTSFVLFAAGAFGGMWAADKLGNRALKVMGLTTGVVLALFLLLFVLSR